MGKMVCFIDWEGQVASCIHEDMSCKDCPDNPFPGGIIPSGRDLKRSKIFTVKEKKVDLEKQNLPVTVLMALKKRSDEDMYDEDLLSICNRIRSHGYSDEEIEYIKALMDLDKHLKKCEDEWRKLCQ